MAFVITGVGAACAFVVVAARETLGFHQSNRDNFAREQRMPLIGLMSGGELFDVASVDPPAAPGPVVVSRLGLANLTLPPLILSFKRDYEDVPLPDPPVRYRSEMISLAALPSQQPEPPPPVPNLEPLPVQRYQLASVSAPAPEPATWTMLLVGLGAVGVALRRRRRAGSAERPSHRLAGRWASPGPSR